MWDGINCHLRMHTAQNKQTVRSLPMYRRGRQSEPTRDEVRWTAKAPCIADSHTPADSTCLSRCGQVLHGCGGDLAHTQKGKRVPCVSRGDVSRHTRKCLTRRRLTAHKEMSHEEMSHGTQGNVSRGDVSRHTRKCLTRRRLTRSSPCAH
jgi:hypothetical protein